MSKLELFGLLEQPDVEGIKYLANVSGGHYITKLMVGFHL
jgi:hypothetical protein